MLTNSEALAVINSSVRTITAEVALNGATFAHTDALQAVTVERAGAQGLFFGFGICQKATVKLIDRERALSVAAGSELRIRFNDFECLPAFHVTETHRDEAANGLSITAYDAIYAAAGLTVADLGLTAPYTVQDVAEACAAALGLAGIAIEGVGSAETCFATSYENGANFEGSETLREALDDVAEATQTIYYVTAGGLLCFKRLAKDGVVQLTIDRSRYFSMESRTSRRLGTICSATELGDNVSASTTASGSTQYVRENAFWALRDDVGTLVEAAVAAAGGLTINQFDCEWRGNFLLELGDKIALQTKDGGTVTAYLLDDTISYSGAYSQRTAWSYTDSEESESNPSSLGDALKQTYARVDKANRQIELAVMTAESAQAAVSGLEIGARNLLRHTGKMPVVSNFTNLEGIATFGTGTLEDTGEGLKLTYDDNGSGSMSFPLAYDGAVESGEEVTLSFEYRGNLENAGRAYFLQRTTPNVTVDGLFSGLTASETEWQRYERTFSSASANVRTCYALLVLYNSGVAGAWVEIRKGSMKLERGGKATDWTPAVEDTEDDITAAQGTANAASVAAEGVRSQMAALRLDLDGINAEVRRVEGVASDKMEGMSGEIAELTSRVDASITPDAVQLQIEQTLSDGVEKVTTSTGFTFDDEGLTVSKSGSDLTTTITEDGMTVALSGEDVLTANNQGVNAKNLHATTYLIIGENSRFEDYEKDGEARTGCFWIGPVSS